MCMQVCEWCEVPLVTQRGKKNQLLKGFRTVSHVKVNSFLDCGKNFDYNGRY